MRSPKSHFCVYSILSLQSILVFIANYISSSLSSSAHDFISHLYAFLSNKRFSVQHRLKISAFVEKLCGPVIGYYFYDLFPFTNYEFYEYFYEWFIIRCLKCVIIYITFDLLFIECELNYKMLSQIMIVLLSLTD